MSSSDDEISLWEESETEHRQAFKRQAKSDKELVINAIDEVEERYKRMNAMVDGLKAQASQSVRTGVELNLAPSHLNVPIREGSPTQDRIVKSLGSASSATAIHEWSKALPDKQALSYTGVSPPRVIQMPEWIAILQLMAVQIPELNKVADELELLGTGYFYTEQDRKLTETAGEWISANIGPVDIQVFRTRISSLKTKIGSRTKVKGGEAIEVCPHLPVRYFYAHVVSVLKDDLEEISLKILASSPNTPASSVIEIGRGRNPYHIKGVGSTWSKIMTAVAQLRSRTRPWVE